jgi:ketosteroid isomerase-like protein
MNKRLLFIATAGILSWSLQSVGSTSKQDDAEKEVMKVDQEWLEAEVARDGPALRRILDDNFIAVYGSGRVADKETFIRDVLGDGTDTVSSHDFGDYTFRIQGDTAMLVETGTIRGTRNGKPYVNVMRVSVTYIRRNGKWRALAEHFGRAVDARQEEAAIRKADGDWLAAAQTKKADAWLAFYTEDAIVLPPNDKIAMGREAARKSVSDLLALPGFTIKWAPTKVSVAQGGDSAYLVGAYSLDYKDAAGKPQSDHGKMLEVWKKQPDGSWLCVADMWNSDVAAGPTS